MMSPSTGTEIARDPSTRIPYWVGMIDVFLGSALIFAIWGLIPIRFAPIDWSATIVGAVLLGVGTLTFVAPPRAGRIVRWGNGIALVWALCLVTAIGWSIAYLAGLYGPVGKGGAALFSTALALVIPYLIGLPAVALWGSRRVA